jgi:hypothetical protein
LGNTTEPLKKGTVNKIDFVSVEDSEAENAASDYFVVSDPFWLVFQLIKELSDIVINFLAGILKKGLFFSSKRVLP